MMGGYQLMVVADVLRARFRNGFERPEPVPANQVVPYTLDLHAADYTFKAGHRIMVQVQSTWFPAFDRNPQRYVPNIYRADASDFTSATERVWVDGDAASSIEVHVLGLP